MRNLFAIVAIILTTILFTGLFTVTAGIVQLQQEQTMRQVGTKAHSGLKDVTMEECKAIVSNPLVVDWDYRRILSCLTNKELSKRQTQLEVSNEKNMKTCFHSLRKGTMPKSQDHIVMDDITMKMMHVPMKIGSKVSIQFDFLGETYEHTFTLCGWYEGDSVARASSVYVSEDYFKLLSKGKTDEELRKAAQEKKIISAGLFEVNLFFKNSKNIEENTRKVIKDAGYEPSSNQETKDGIIAYGVNWAYLSTSGEKMDASGIAIIVIIGLIIGVSGYLIIYNIFYISIINDIHFYGLLKTIGTTKKQIMKMIRRQAIILSGIGIPIGLLIGYVIGTGMIPTLFSMMNISSVNFQLEVHPFIFAFSILFSLITVFISSYKPGKIAGKVSPIEAVNYEEVKIKMKGRKQRKKFGIARMAWNNIKRSKKKAVLVILSLSFSVILLVEIVTFAKGFNISMYLKENLVDDVMLGTASLYNQNPSSGNDSLKIDDEYYNYVKNLEGIRYMDDMYTTENPQFHYLSDDAYQKYKKYYEDGKLMDDVYNHEKIEGVIKNRDSISDMRYAYSTKLLSHLKVLEGSIDVKKFETGKYILVTPYGENLNTFYHPGDKVTIQYQTDNSKFQCGKETEYGPLNMHYTNTKNKEYEVMAVVSIPYCMTRMEFYVNSLYTILPVTEFKKMEYEPIRFRAGAVIENGAETDIENAIKEYTENVNPQMDYRSKKAYEAEFSGLTRGYLIIGGAIAFVIGLIGILNYINTMVTNVVTRKKEMAMLESIGLTELQMKKMLMLEGVYYIIISGVVSILVASFISVGFIRMLNHIISCFTYHYIWSPYVIVYPAFLFVAIVVPLINYRVYKKKSLVERL